MLVEKINEVELYGKCIHDIDVLTNCTVIDVCHYDDTDVVIETDKGILLLYHERDCCEKVWLEDGYEELKQIIGEKIIKAEMCCSRENPLDCQDEDDTFTWTFYKISTFNHDVSLRFYGMSSGWYSEKIDIKWLKKD